MRSHVTYAFLLAASSTFTFIPGIEGCSSGSSSGTSGSSSGSSSDASTKDGASPEAATEAGVEAGADGGADSAIDSAPPADASEASVGDSGAGGGDADAGPACGIALDPTFGTQGTVQLETAQGIASTAQTMLVQPDGKIVVTGNPHPLGQGIAVARFATDGTLDPSFGAAGIATLTATTSPRALALQPDGKILVGGESGVNWFLGRLDASGTADATFGTSGYATAPAGAGIAQAIAVRPGGAIVVAAIQYISGQAWLQVEQFNASGALDTTFGTGGTTTTTFSTFTQAIPDSIALQPDGSVLVGGYGYVAGDAGPTYQVAIVRYTPTGQLDTSFGTAGLAASAIGAPYGAIQSIALQTSGAIVAAVSGQGQFAAVRFTTSGQLDTSFGTAGIVKVPMLGSLDAAVKVLVMPDDSILLTGQAVQPIDGGYQGEIGVAKLTASGTLETSFGAGGKVLTTCPGLGPCYGNGAGFGPNHTLIVGAAATTPIDGGNQYGIDLARYTCP